MIQRFAVRLLTSVALTVPLILSVSSASAVSLDGMGMIKQWTDFENQAGDMPAFIWGNSDALAANRIGLSVTFQNGLSGTITYSGVSGLWNSSFADKSADAKTGFFTSAGGLHILFNSNTGGTLPMAWNGFSMLYSNNFDLDYTNFGNSNFRASASGWGSAVFTTFSSAVPADPVSVPDSGSTLALISISLLGVALVSRRGAEVQAAPVRIATRGQRRLR